MDNMKTGSLIKELRKEKSMTQKDLADLLHITDKAVSKWERGLCAPDISLLEPLSKSLDISIVELIEGERIIKDEHTAEVEENVKNVIDYSKNEIAYKTKLFKKKYLITTGICVAVAAFVCFFCLWWTGYFHIIDKSLSPNTAIEITVYDKDVTNHSFVSVPAISVFSKNELGAEYRNVYLNASYQGIWWAPDSTKYVLALTHDKEPRLLLTDFVTSSESDLSTILYMGVEAGELSQYGLQYDAKTIASNIEYQFLQWSSDSTAMLIYYSFIDTEQALHTGYFWYNSANGNVYAPFALEMREQ